MADNRFSSSLKLKQHTPMIHFQHNEVGAILRATELKPKLDKFIMERVSGLGGEDAEKFFMANHRNWLVGKGGAEHIALDYKISIVSHDANPQKGLIEIIPPEKKTHVLSRKIQLSLFCFNPSLKEKVEENLSTFFALHNFGTRQNKAWGCFTPEGMTQADFETALKSSGKAVYKKRGNVNPENFYQDLMRDTWQILKSGKNFRGYVKSHLFKYMAANGVRWEKRAIKKELKSLIDSGNLPSDLRADHPPVDVVAGETGCQQNHSAYFDWEDNSGLKFDYRFVRLLLGMPEHYEYRAYNNYIYQVRPVSSQGIERFKAPVTFKIFNNSMYAIAEKIPAELNASKRFQFKLHVKRDNNPIGAPIDLKLDLPLPDSFDLVAFLDGYFPCVGFDRL